MGTFRGRAIATVALATAGFTSGVHANYNGVDYYEEYGQRIQSAQAISAESYNVFGDSTSLYNGQTSFETTDVSIPGNSALPVALSRRLAIVDRYEMPVNGDGLHGFGDWDFDVPYMDGTFTQQNGWTLYSQTPGSTARCSDNTDWPYTAVTIPTGLGFAPYQEIWSGTHLHIPGQGDQELLANTESKSPAYASRSTYKWVTTGNWKLSCIGSVSNLAGEGFVAISPEGVSYKFNYAVTWQTSTYAYQYNPQVHPVGVARVHIYLLATHVQDRFGNYIDYHYTGNQLTDITSSDGRSIHVDWSGDTISSVTSALGTWQYGYSTATWTNEIGVQHSWPYLSSVTRPDGSTWTYSVVSGALITNKEDWPDDSHPPPNHCQLSSVPNSGSFVYKVGTPSGATGVFTFNYARSYRTYVPKGCVNNPDPRTNYPQRVFTYLDNFQLASKKISGPGVVNATWEYGYDGPAGAYYTASSQYVGDGAEPYIPPGICLTSDGDPCASAKTVVVTGPTSVTNYTFGIEYARNEGQLIDTEVDDPSTGAVLKTTTNVYVSDDDAPTEPFANITGYDLLPNFADPMGNRNRPTVSTQIVQDGATFRTSTNDFDGFARSTSQPESGSASRTVYTSYYDDLSQWVIGQVASKSIVSAAACSAGNTDLMSCTTYDPDTALPLKSYDFGKLVSSKTWYGDGTLHTIADGKNNTTTLSNWKRGLPQSIGFADGNGESAEVSDAGWITSVTDENNYETDYHYDLMGRLSEIDYPVSDDVAWNKTFLSFVPVTAAEYGVPAGHWKQTVHTGNGYKVTYFDALWRPLVTESYDSANPNGTRSVSVKRYDAGGRAIYASYPLASLGSYTDAHPGASTRYDAIDRVTEVDADSELGSLPSKTAYLSGFKTQVTNPRGKVTTTSYMTYGEPGTDWPVSIAMPEDETTTISRDVYGKPLQLVRSGDGLSLTRSFVYDENQQLCKRIEPETSATVFSYDDAGNLQWSAGGLNLPSTGSCDTSAANSSGRRVDRTYDERNRLETVTYPDSFSDTGYTYYPDGKVDTATSDNDGHPVTTTYNYDKRRLLTSESLAIAGTAPLSLNYDYDANGYLKSITYPDNRLVNFSPNAVGQATAVGSYASAVSYFPNGGIHQFTYGNGAVHTTTQNTRQLPDRMTDARSGVAAHDDGYDYDEDTNVAAITDYVNSSRDRDMGYDDLDRLLETDSPMFGGDNKAVYDYDTLDNLRSARVGNFSDVGYGYDLANHLSNLTDPNTGASIVSYLYDAQGNVSNKNNQIFQFDMGNRLRSVTGAESYYYDAAGRRVQKRESGSGSIIDSMYSQAGVLMYRAVPASMNLTDYIYLSGDLLAKVTNNTSAVIGTIDGIPTESSPTVGGWACSTGLAQSINVELYVGGPPGSGTRIGTYTANLPSEAGIASSCQVSSGNYRFSIPLGDDTRAQYAGQVIYVIGDSPIGNDNSQLSGSGQYTVPPNPTPPDAPASISVPSSSSTGLVTVSWTPSTNTTSYVLQQSANGGSWAQIYSGTATSFALNLANGSYQYQVEACNADGCSAFTTSGTLTVAIIPAAPATITVPSTNYTGSFAVSWSSSANATNGYVLNQSLNGGTWTQLYSGSSTSRTVTVSASGSYKYEVMACGAGGCSSYRVSGTVAVTLKPASAPSLSGPSTSSSGTYTLSWTAVSGATTYQLKQKINSGSWTTVYNSTGRSWSSDGVGTGSYAYQAYACNVAGCGPVSNTVTVTVHRIPDPPASLTVSPAQVASGHQVSFSWNASSEATSYKLQHTNPDTGATSIVWSGTTTGTALTINGPADTVHDYNVQACNSYGCSGWSNTVGVYVTGTGGGGPKSQPASGGSAAQ